MSRPWIEFIQSQHLPWQAGDLGGTRAGLEFRQLSADRDTGACSLLVRYPAGWHGAGGALAVDDEFLVLEGSLEIAKREYAQMSYAHLPAGLDTGAWSSRPGAIVIELQNGIRDSMNAAWYCIRTRSRLRTREISIRNSRRGRGASCSTWIP